MRIKAAIAFRRLLVLRTFALNAQGAANYRKTTDVGGLTLLTFNSTRRFIPYSDLPYMDFIPISDYSDKGAVGMIPRRPVSSFLPSDLQPACGSLAIGPSAASGRTPSFRTTAKITS